MKRNLRDTLRLCVTMVILLRILHNPKSVFTNSSDTIRWLRDQRFSIKGSDGSDSRNGSGGMVPSFARTLEKN